MSYTINHTIKCCIKCVAPKRYPGCQDHCPQHIAEKEEYKAKKAAADKKKAIEAGLDAQAIYGVDRAKKRRKGKY